MISSPVLTVERPSPSWVQPTENVDSRFQRNAAASSLRRGWCWPSVPSTNM
ncbi:MAG: hypothetical protein IPJ04_05290 [Candidatus Eisenbacteria bacterium]|nr:hypothetical protein [Candidatus Eisenbacteria bacterium]